MQLKDYETDRTVYSGSATGASIFTAIWLVGPFLLRLLRRIFTWLCSAKAYKLLCVLLPITAVYAVYRGVFTDMPFAIAMIDTAVLGICFLRARKKYKAGA